MKIDPRFTDLMQSEIDGANSTQESAELHAYLARNPQARDHCDQLRAIAGALDRIEEVAPPADLKSKIIAAVRQKGDAEIPGSHPASRESAPTRGRIVLRYGYALAAGVILGVLGHQWATSDGFGVDPSKVTGALATPEVAAPITEIPVDFEGAIGYARFGPAGSGYDLEIEMTSETPVEIDLAYSAEAVVFRGFSSDLGEIDTLEVATDGIRWVQLGRHKVTVSLANQGASEATVEVKFFVDKEFVHSVAVGLPGPG
jgi:hypothetical protein